LVLAPPPNSIDSTPLICCQNVPFGTQKTAPLCGVAHRYPGAKLARFMTFERVKVPVFHSESASFAMLAPVSRRQRVVLR
jgi:hypothetical protein